MRSFLNLKLLAQALEAQKCRHCQGRNYAWFSRTSTLHAHHPYAVLVLQRWVVLISDIWYVCLLFHIRSSKANDMALCKGNDMAFCRQQFKDAA